MNNSNIPLHCFMGGYLIIRWSTIFALYLKSGTGFMNSSVVTLVTLSK